MNINKITKAEYSKIWPLIMDEYDIISEEHRKQSSFYVSSLHTIDENLLPDNPELYGLWLSGVWIRDTEYGSDLPDTLFRVKRVETEVCKIEVNYVLVGE